jgi:hypothetical protein
MLLIPGSNVVLYLAFQFSEEMKRMYQACKFHANSPIISKVEEVQKLGEEGGMQKWETWWHLLWKYKCWVVTCGL